MKDYLEASKESFSSSVAELKSFDWGDITDADTIGLWPKAVKILLGFILFVICIGGGIWFHIKNLKTELETITAQENNLKRDFENKAILAVNLELYKAQMQEMEASFGALLSQLPGETEVPGLLEDINFTGLGNGLEFSTIQLSSEVIQEFYIELPINMNVTGTYHDFGGFVSGVASLSRIVTLHDFNITRGARGALNMSITAKTYRYLPSNE